ncbi:endonuclease/exonuclease/phosphatase family protein [Sphingobacterium sp. SGG-5]|uniref:endonuclease/exonuclease/phosphatase family protein n=1 Tax=Sphingobacterium sp. SGG-5 TaxID=2710881 RepID=UPI0013ED1127|nr:endonuclease/exonuclease/phosphatase family protein [Sphingobacterium sp. SGG-5]NGM60610.1 endonuclease/exonuclease/phosphatase family protein [Sphingobacterium sp. SGG-5]
MKYCLFSLLIILLTNLLVSETYAQKKLDDAVTLDIMTFNIRMNYQDDGVNNWQFRREYMTDLIKWYQPDLLGAEEAYYPQYSDMTRLLTDYGAFGPIEGRQGAESVAVFYLKSRLTCIDSGTFWLSQTPDQQSVGWDANLRRTVTWGAFEIKGSDRKVYLFVTHFDHKGKTAREESAKLLLQKVHEIAGDTQAFIVGDFNFREESIYYKILSSGNGTDRRFYDTNKLAEKYYGPSWTLHDFGLMSIEKRPKIDYIFTNKKIRVTHFVNISEQRGNVYPSDHNPQMATVEF